MEIHPVPVLSDNFRCVPNHLLAVFSLGLCSYLLIDKVTREAAAVDPADPFTVMSVAEKLVRDALVDLAADAAEASKAAPAAEAEETPPAA